MFVIHITVIELAFLQMDEARWSIG